MFSLMCVLLLLMQQPACTDFTGSYVIQGEDGRVAVEIRQSGCTRISISWESSLYPNSPPVVHSLMLGGVFQTDRAWFSQNGIQQTAVEVKPGRLELFQRPLPESSVDRRSLMLRLDRLPDGDLCVSTERTNPRSPAMRASRVRSAGKTAEDAAAGRSYGGCEPS